MSTNIKNIIEFFEKDISDVSRQYEWDNSGAQILLEYSDIDKVALALDPSVETIDKAIYNKCNLLITHHPLIFNKLKNIKFNSTVGTKIFKAIESKLNILSYHTSLDLADYSLNHYLSDLLEAETISVLERTNKEKLYKFVVFVPIGYENDILAAIDNGGGGRIGNYSKVSFRNDGIGSFMPNEKASPFIGKKGQLESVKEYRIEAVVPFDKINSVVSEVLKAHPYEEVAYDIFVNEIGKYNGLGQVCCYKDKISFKNFLELLSQKFYLDNIVHSRQTIEYVEKFAIVSGSGASYWKNCADIGVKLLLTSDLKHHDALDAYEKGITIIDITHFKSEKIYMEYLSSHLKSKFGLEVIIIDEEPSLINWRK